MSPWQPCLCTRRRPATLLHSAVLSLLRTAHTITRDSDSVMLRWVRAPRPRPRPRHGLPVHHRVHYHHHPAAALSADTAPAPGPGPAFPLLSHLRQALHQEVRPLLDLCAASPHLSFICSHVLCSRLPLSFTSPRQWIALYCFSSIAADSRLASVFFSLSEV